MSTFKKFLALCAVEVMIGGGFLVVGILCLANKTYDGAAVCAGMVVIAAVFAIVRYRRLRAQPASIAPEFTPIGRKALPARKKPAAKRKPTKKKAAPKKRK